MMLAALPPLPPYLCGRHAVPLVPHCRFFNTPFMSYFAACSNVNTLPGCYVLRSWCANYVLPLRAYVMKLQRLMGACIL